MSTHTDLARNRPALTWLDIGPRRLRSTWAWFDSACIGSDLFGSTSSCFDSGQHCLVSTRVNIVLFRLGSTLARVDSAQFGLGPTQLNMGSSRLGSVLDPGRLNSVWARTNSSHHWPSPDGYGLTRLDMGPMRTQPGPGADLTRALTHSAWLGPGLTRLDFGLERPDSTLAYTDSIQLGPGRLGSTWTWVDFAQPGPELSWLNLDRSKSKSNPKCNLDNPKMDPIYI